MRFDYRCVDSLPRLAWCAMIRAGDDEVVVYHGSWVETRSDRFFEAAWNGDYRAGDFDKATTMLGTGARLDGDRVLFATPTDTEFFLFSLASADSLIVSNSLAFSLVHGGTSPDIGYPYYLYDFYALRRSGLTTDARRLRTADGRFLHAYMYKHFCVDRGLSVEVIPTTHHPAATNFDAYLEMLKGAMAAVLENAAHPDRLLPLSPITTISRGYDSTAVSALAADVGCQDAITYTTDELGWDDSGEDNAACLGLNVSVVNQFDFHELSGYPEAEFCASNPSGAGMMIACLASQLEGRIMLKGDMGDNTWSTDAADGMPNLRRPHIQGVATTSMNEFRLRAGTLIFDVPAIGAVHSGEIHRITQSQEMRPWTVGGDYDRPIPRRIAEGAGLPRDNFGKQKMFGLHQAGSRNSLTPESLADFRDFYASANAPWTFRKSHRTLNSDLVTRPFEPLLLYLKNTPRAIRLYKLLAFPIMRLTSWRAHDWRRRSPYLYLFHWGFEKIKGRYELSDRATAGTKL